VDVEIIGKVTENNLHVKCGFDIFVLYGIIAVEYMIDIATITLKTSSNFQDS